MCVAVIVESEKGPSAVEMWQMDDANPHGVGVAWCPPNSDLVRYKKGLNWKAAHELLKNLPRPVLLHFRWATHGGQARHLSHPFPIGPRALTSRKLNGAAKAVLMHNGVWTSYRAYAPDSIKLDKWSDTAVAAYAAGVYGEEILEHVDWATAVARAAGQGRMDITMRGTWTEYDGNMYSNLHWLPSEQFRATTGRSKWGDYPVEGWTRESGVTTSFEPVSLEIESGWNKQRDVEIDRWVKEYEEAQEAIKAMPPNSGAFGPSSNSNFDSGLQKLAEKILEEK